jgi:hypothetical protein
MDTTTSTAPLPAARRTVTLRRQADGTFAGHCPTCRSRNVLSADLGEATLCTHFRRSWGKSAGGRVRAEFSPRAYDRSCVLAVDHRGGCMSAAYAPPWKLRQAAAWDHQPCGKETFVVAARGGRR